jgi:hypothetical protein
MHFSNVSWHASHSFILLSYLGPPNASTSQASGGAKVSKKYAVQKKPLEAAGSAQPPSRFSFLIHNFFIIYMKSKCITILWNIYIVAVLMKALFLFQ